MDHPRIERRRGDEYLSVATLVESANQILSPAPTTHSEFEHAGQRTNSSARRTVLKPGQPQSRFAWRMRRSKAHERTFKGAKHEVISGGNQRGVTRVTTCRHSEVDQGHQVL